MPAWQAETRLRRMQRRAKSAQKSFLSKELEQIGRIHICTWVLGCSGIHYKHTRT